MNWIEKMIMTGEKSDISKRSQYKPVFRSFVPMIICLSLLLIKGCITPFDPEIEKYDNVLVVDGLLTNLPNTCKVTLSRTYPYDKKHPLPERNAVVKIIDDLGNETTLPENADGTYLPEVQNFIGIIGRKYKVFIKTASGQVCESAFEELKEPVDIGKVYYEYVEKEGEINGIQLYIDTNDPLKKSFYYSWDYEETWEFWVPYQSQSLYLPEMKICYNEVSSRKVLIESTKDYVDDKVIGFPLYFVGNTTDRLSVKYSVLVRQYVLSEKTYLFFKNLK